MNRIEPPPFGERLRLFRARAALSQQELAERAGLSVDAVSALERGVRRRAYPHTVRALAEALALSPAERAAFARATADGSEQSATTAQPLSDLRASQLPVAVTPLIGREQDEAALTRLLARDAVRLVTVTGPGGVGKTSLAIQVATDVQHLFDAAVYVALASLNDSELVLPTIAQAIGVSQMGGTTASRSIVAAIRGRSLLLILDNFEHVAQSASILAELLGASPTLKLLVTSRSALQLRGEHEYPLSPLAVPQPGIRPSLLEFHGYPAVRLFVERAQAVSPTFSLTEATAQAVGDICVRLDGLPLALELAAARIRVLTPQAIRTRLTNADVSGTPALDFLRGGPQDAPNRHQTLRDAIAWSYDLLAPDEQALFRRLAVFAGGSSLEAAEAICRAIDPRAGDLLDEHESLVRSSLLQRKDVHGTARFSMLETIRQFARDLLHNSEECNAFQRSHAAHFLDLAEKSEPWLRGPQQADWLDRLEIEIDNLREALRHFAEIRDAEHGLRLATALKWFWWDRGYLRQGQEWLTTFLALPATAVPPAIRVRALNGASYFAGNRGEYGDAISLAAQALRLARQLGDREGSAWSLAYLTAAHYRRGDVLQARTLAEQSLRLFRQGGPPGGVLFATAYAGLAAQDLGDDIVATTILQEGIALGRQLGDRDDLSRCLLGMGFMTLYNQSDALRALPYFQESFEVSIALGQPPLHSLDGLSGVAAVENRPVRALRLAGAAAALREEHGAVLFPHLRAKHDRLLQRAWSALSEDAGASAWGEGRALSMDELRTYVLANDDC